MKKILAIVSVLLFAPVTQAALIGLRDGNAAERAALVGTLNSMGHTVTDVIDGNLDLIISAPGNGTGDFAGVPYLQISDHGADHLNNGWTSLTAGTPVTITLSGAHPILTGLSPSWTTLGFWRYGSSSDYIGYVSSVPGIADAEAASSTYDDVLAVSGADIYIGWNVYGPDATSNDLQLLRNAIEFLVTGTVTGAQPTAGGQPTAVPVMSTYGLWITVLGILALATRRFYR